jgi:tetratricopeptide (TPR) repeat protein
LTRAAGPEGSSQLATRQLRIESYSHTGEVREAEGSSQLATRQLRIESYSHTGEVREAEGSSQLATRQLRIESYSHTGEVRACGGGTADFSAAIDDFSAVLAQDANNANAFFNRGSAHDSLGDFDKAILDYTRALDLDMAQGGKKVDRG